MLSYHWCPVHGKERCLMGGEDGDIKSHGCRRGEALVWRGPIEVRIMGVINEFIERMGR